MAVSSTTGGLRTGVCLSTDRPQNPYNGQVIYETDTNRTLVWDNSAWVVIADASTTGFPTSLDTGTVGAIEALQAKVGVNSSAVTSSLDYRVSDIETVSSNVQQTVVDTYIAASVAANSFGAMSGFTVSITPKVSTHKVLVIAHINGTQVSGNVTRIGFRFTRGGSPIGVAAAASNRSLLTAQNIPLGTNAEQSTSVSMMYLDSPATTSATTYGIDVFNYDAGNTRSVGLNAMNDDNDHAYVTRTISTITAIEVPA